MYLFIILTVVFGQIYLTLSFPSHHSSYGGQGTDTADQTPVQVEVRLSEAENPIYRDQSSSLEQGYGNHEAIYDYYNPYNSQVQGTKETGRFDESKHHQRMHLRMLTEPGAPVCNDGTQAGYYLLKNSGNSHWVVSLQGGWYCYDETSCGMRMVQTPNLMGSRNWKPKKLGSGILSPYSSENPHLWRSNMVYVPYCSSDAWSGDGSVQRFQNRHVYFMGSKIIDEVIKDLAQHHGLLKAKVIILTGSSAGGTGVLLNLDRIQKLVHALGSEAKVRGIIDSSWYLLRPETENKASCDSGGICSPVASLKIGVQLWNPLLPEGCADDPMDKQDAENNDAGSGGSSNNVTTDNRWRCFFGQHVYPHVKSPLFVIQWLFDEVQLNSDRIDISKVRTMRERRRFLKYITELERSMRSSLKTVSAVFAPSCVSHALLEKREWVTTSVKQTRLPDAVKCWENSLDRRNKPQSSKQPPQQTDPIKPEDNQHSYNLNTSQAEAPTNSSDLFNKTKRHIDWQQYSENVEDPSDLDKAETMQPGLSSDATDAEDYYYGEDYRYVEYLNDYPREHGWDAQYGGGDRAEDPLPAHYKSEKNCGDLQLIETCFGPLCNPTCPPIYLREARALLNGHVLMTQLGSNFNEQTASNEDSSSFFGMLHTT